MSDDQKVEQVGAAAIAYSDARVDLAHSAQRLKALADNYAHVAETLKRSEGDKFLSSESVKAELGNALKLLFDSVKLQELLDEHQKNKMNAGSKLAQLTRLGISLE